MRGINCSWAEMHRARQALSTLDRGHATRYAALRCVDKSTVSDWRAIAAVMDVLDEEMLGYPNFEHFQPSHAKEIARAYRRNGRGQWDPDTQQQIIDWVLRCEDERLTVEQLRQHLNGFDPQPLPAAPATAHSYRTIYADPPWQYDNKASRGPASNHYPTLSIKQICDLTPFNMPVADLVAPNAHLFLWTTSSFLPHAFPVIEAWGFTYKSIFVWCKP